MIKKILLLGLLAVSLTGCVSSPYDNYSAVGYGSGGYKYGCYSYDCFGGYGSIYSQPYYYNRSNHEHDRWSGSEGRDHDDQRHGDVNHSGGWHNSSGGEGGHSGRDGDGDDGHSGGRHGR